MKTNNSLRAAIGIACIGIMFTACAKEDQVLPNTMIPALTDDHREARERGLTDAEKQISIYQGTVSDQMIDRFEQDGKQLTKSQVVVIERSGEDFKQLTAKPTILIERFEVDSKQTTKKPVTECLECDPERDGHYIEINGSEAR